MDVLLHSNTITVICAGQFIVENKNYNFVFRGGFRGMILSNCDRVLQASMPSYHVRRILALTALPHFLNQEPPRPQQLALPDFSMIPHVGHADPLDVIVVVAVSIHVWVLVKETGKSWTVDVLSLSTWKSALTYIRRPSHLQTTYVPHFCCRNPRTS